MQSSFERIIEKDSGPKAWAKNDLRKLISTAVAGKVIAYMPRNMAKKSLGEHNISPLTQRTT
ncbi:hypothetical protein LguiA_004718 [Lonicera macranthoides]